jgi:TRAP-type C4-dicarboxylate transport system substrate-binding protein
VAKYFIITHLSYSTFPVRINKKKWDQLPKDVQKVMLEAAIEAQEWGRKEAQKMAKETLETLIKKGLNVYKPPESEIKRWRTAAYKPCTELFLRRAGERGKTLLELVEKGR